MKRRLLIFLLLFCFFQAAFSQSGTELSTKFIKFYPNPAVSSINFEFQHDYDKSHTIEIYNFIGKRIVEFKPTSDRINLPLDEFYRGIYIYQLRDRAGKILESGKFQVIK